MLVRHKRNGQTEIVVSYEDAKEVTCPKCLAAPGEPCVGADKTKPFRWSGNHYVEEGEPIRRAHPGRIVKRRLEYERQRSSG